MTLDDAIRENKEDLKKLIQKYEEELNKRNFGIIYDHINLWYLKVAFTALLLKNNINPLEYMNEIPSCFAYELNLKEFVIPDSIMSIGSEAFKSCTSLSSIKIPDGVTSIGDRAFGYCKSLTSITIPKSVTSIDYRAFKDCNSLTDVYYKGPEEDWNKIKIENDNDELLTANIHYNS